MFAIKRCCVYVGTLYILSFSLNLRSQEEYLPELLDIRTKNKVISGADIDLSELNKAPYLKAVQVYINDESYGEKLFTFHENKIVLKDYISVIEEILEGNFNAPLTTKNTHIAYNPSDNRLDFRLDHRLLVKESSRFKTNPLLWDDGEFMVRLRYNLRGEYNHGEKKERNYRAHIPININWRKWQLRSYYKHDIEREFDGVVVRRNINPIEGFMEIGDIQENLVTGRAIGLRGISLGSNELIYSSETTRALPAIHGFVTEPTEILIYENERLIYQNIVEAGNYSIRDYYTSGQGVLKVVEQSISGDIENIRDYRLSYLRQLLKTGEFRYDFALGEYESKSAVSIFSGDLYYGLPLDFTAHLGWFVGKGYVLPSVGLGGMTNYGSWFFNGGFLRYSKYALESGGTSAVYSFDYSYYLKTASTRIAFSYDHFSDSFISHDNIWLNRNRDDLIVSRLLAYTSSSLTKNIDFHMTYRRHKGRLSDYNSSINGKAPSTRELSLGLSFSFPHDIDLKVNYIRSLDDGNGLLLNLSVPLFGKTRLRTLTYFNGDESYIRNEAYNSYKDGRYRFNFKVANHNEYRGDYNTTDLYANGNNELTRGQLYIGRNGGESVINAGLYGSVFFHNKGVAFSDTSAQSFGLVYAKDGGTFYDNNNNIYLKNGMSVVDIFPYQSNVIRLSKSGLPLGVTIERAFEKVIPTYGAFILLDFQSAKGVIVNTIITHRGKSLPYGTAVLNANKETVTILGFNGRLYLGFAVPGEILYVNTPDGLCKLTVSLEKLEVLACD